MTPALGLPLILIGGWMTGHSSVMLVAAPLVIACGLIGGGLFMNKAAPKELRATIWIGFAISILLGVGAFQQWREGSVMAVIAIGFAAAMVLTTLTAGLPRESVERGMVVVRAIAFASVGHAVAQLFAGVDRVTGIISLNPNALAGLLLITAVHWLMASKTRFSLWGSFVLLMGIPLTGSRWAILCFACILVYLVVAKVVSVRGAALLSLVLVFYIFTLVNGTIRFQPIAVTPPTPPIESEARGAQTPKGAIAYHVHDAQYRWYVPSELFPTLTPQGFLGPLGFRGGGHNTLSRVAVETGWIGLLLFVSVIVLTFLRANKTLRPVLGAFLLLGMADYYIWGPFQLAPLMWAFFGLSAQTGDSV